MDDKQPQKAIWPTHGWGALARDPWMKIGSDSETHRQVLRRYWVRNGGDGEIFDELVPPADKHPAKVRR